MRLVPDAVDRARVGESAYLMITEDPVVYGHRIFRDHEGEVRRSGRGQLTAVRAFTCPLPANEFEPLPPVHTCGDPSFRAGKKS